MYEHSKDQRDRKPIQMDRKVVQKLRQMIADTKAMPDADIATPQGKRRARDKRRDMQRLLKIKKLLLRHTERLERSVDDDPLLLSVGHRRRATRPKEREAPPVFEFETRIGGTMFHLTAEALDADPLRQTGEEHAARRGAGSALRCCRTGRKRRRKR